jgi:hypothetical protein
VNTKRFYVVLDVADDYEGGTEDVALWIDHALGKTQDVDSEVFESFEDLAETERLNDEFQPDGV